MPEREQLLDLLYAEPKIPRSPYELQRVDITLVIIPVARVPACRGCNQADLLVMADHSLAHARRCRNLADLHSRTPLKRSELPITVTELKAIAAPAMIGLSRMLNHG